jgi:hypothetical protein
MNKEKPPVVDREAVRVLAIELGVREAARRCGLSEDRVRKWSSRYKWLQQSTPKQKEAAVTVVTTPAAALKDAHNELATQTRTSLAKATAAAATKAAGATIPVCSTSHLRELAQAAARVFGWDSNKPAMQFNQCVISQEQLAQIREARRAMLEAESPSLAEGENEQ